jgi:PPOX class probable F420-dependent enzyme
MAAKVIPESHVDLFSKKAFAHLVTLMPSGAPQVTPVWVDYDGHHVLINTAEGRQKDKNLQRDPRVAFSILDPENPYRYLEVRGRIAERSLKGADQHIDAMAKKYLGKEKYPCGLSTRSNRSTSPRWLEDATLVPESGHACRAAKVIAPRCAVGDSSRRQAS